ncbi:hypothetical protein SOASR030_01140 [Leminorella grimontii]|uniref:YbbD head domain-containing protein n=1 Tax=Leminorella grimontii TaxID=82981 RepID=A0AAV5N0M1_9GAMM|nr:hypothetical protein SOASR030_01140 [Leminorella grimontii]GKX60245.1 hypothetical protein SOASR031_25600 [Leminorella grimontii]VFS60342.1 Uncharacterised protein [Leminorella grimontii]
MKGIKNRSGCRLAIVPVVILATVFYVFIKSFTDAIEVNEFKYDSYLSIPEDSGVKTWLPDFFPKNAKDIDFYSNVDLNTFGVTFSLDDDESKNFEAQLVYSASSEGESRIKKEDDLVSQVWCRRGMYLGESGGIYLIGKYRGMNRYYLINATRHRSFESNYDERIGEIEKTFCILR